jgi:fumarate hydratase subunit alpha
VAGRTVSSEALYRALKEAVLRMNVELPADVTSAIRSAFERETGRGRTALKYILENIDIASRSRLPLCQDTGMIVAFVEVGRGVSFEGEGLSSTIDRAIADAYREGNFRKSVVADPLNGRANTGMNLPAVVYWDFTESDTLRVSCMAKGFGSENCGKVFMLNPTAGREAVIASIVEAARAAGGNPCPPIVVGVGIGGTMDRAAVLSKRALLRDLDDVNPDPYYAALEADALSALNALGIGAGGLGGEVTCLAVKTAVAGTHLAGLPVAVTINCWADRKCRVEL